MPLMNMNGLAPDKQSLTGALKLKLKYRELIQNENSLFGYD